MPSWLNFKINDMEMRDYIAVEVFCRYHNTEVTFISTLQEYDLIEIISVDDAQYIPLHQLSEVEKMLRLRNDLNINTEGIDVVYRLLQKINAMQQEMDMLRSRLRLYEDL